MTMKNATILWPICLALSLTADAPWAGAASPEKADPGKTPAAKTGKPSYSIVGSIERLDPVVDQLLGTNAVIEQLACGFLWAEGPVWMPGGYLLFSDIPTNAVMKWQEGKGVSVYLRPSGYTGFTPRGGERGSNGLTRDSHGRLVLCQHGDRRIARLESNRRCTVLAQYYRGYRFNSPNDLVYDSNGNLYFTDPPYGLEKAMDDRDKELPFQGVYRLSSAGQLALLTSKLSRPNGIAFSPDEKKLYVAVSDPAEPAIMVFDVNKGGTLDGGRVFFNAAELARTKQGLPDGLKVDRKGNLFATGPGGVLVISPEGKHLGTISPGDVVSNCAWGEDGSVLYMTVNHCICRIKTKTKGRP
jgi:gluconolactonase